ncbi:fumarylacetoacetate hydrolase family protein [Paracoccus onubensis]|nr:fumarylacetoacetate hydrolase family protein [Paracoccus onubensis]
MMTPEQVLPQDGYRGTLLARIWDPRHQGPSLVAVRETGLHDVTAHFPTTSHLYALPDPAAALNAVAGERIASLAEVLEHSRPDAAGGDRPYLLPPLDLQAVKAAGVTFVVSMLERVIEERARGNAADAADIRARVRQIVGDDLAALRPGSEQAAEMKRVLVEKGMWSQYLEVGIGPDAEIFTKTTVFASVGFGAHVGIHPQSVWNNPEPEVVLAVSPDARIVGATLGNDVNLRDFEGRSALLLSKAKDNNASCSIGPFMRLFDDSFGLDDLRRTEVEMRVEGRDGFVMDGSSSMAQISRDVTDLVGQAMGANHQYPDGIVLLTGTMFAPVKDRDGAGQGFTHHRGDLVEISAPMLGCLVNTVETSDRCPPWNFGLRQLMRSLVRRGLHDAI